MSPRLSADLIADLVDAGSREHYTDAALYDYEYRRRRADVGFYRELARKRLGEGGRILELGAGSGRVTIPLARAGHEVVALDTSPAMLAKLRARVAALPAAVARRITIVEGDLRDFEIRTMQGARASRSGTRTKKSGAQTEKSDVRTASRSDVRTASRSDVRTASRSDARTAGSDVRTASRSHARTASRSDVRTAGAGARTARSDARTAGSSAPTSELDQFPLVIAVFNVLEHLYTRVEVDACLRSVARHLAPGGAFAFDVQMPDLAWLLRDPHKRWAKTRFTDPATGRAMYYSTNHDYDPVGQIALIRLYYEPVDGKGPTKIVKLSQRKFFPAELEALVAHAGLRMVERYGDFAWHALDGNAESQVLVCEKAFPRRENAFSRRGFSQA